MQLIACEIFSRFGERGDEMRMLGRGQRNPGVTVRKRRELLLEFMRRAAGRDEMDSVKVEAAVGSARHGEMTVVNRIKRAAKQGDAAGVMPCCGAALRLRGGQ